MWVHARPRRPFFPSTVFPCAFWCREDLGTGFGGVLDVKVFSPEESSIFKRDELSKKCGAEHGAVCGGVNPSDWIS